MKYKFNVIVLALLVVSTSLFGQSATRSLSGDNWKNPSRTKTWTPPSITDDIVGATDAKTLTNKTINGANNTLSNIPVDMQALLDGSPTATTTIQAPLNQITRTAAGKGLIETGNPNLLKDPSAEGTTTPWAIYFDAAGVNPTDGTGTTGGSPTITVSNSSLVPLAGIKSLLLSKPGSSAQGQGISLDFTIDRKDAGKVLQGKFDYEISSGTYADNDIAVWIYHIDGGNSKLIQPAPYLLKNSGIVEGFPFEFQTQGGSGVALTYRMIFHIASTSTNAYDIKFDNFSVGQQAKLYGSAVLAPIPFISTFTGLGNATQALSYQKIGSTVRITGTVIIGTTLPTSTMTFSLPPGMSADYSSVPKGIVNNDQYQAVGYATSYPGGLTGRIQRLGGSLTEFLIGYTSGGVWSATVPGTWSAGQSFTLDLVVPILGWSSSTIMSSDADTRVVSAKYTKTTPQTVPSVSFGTNVVLYNNLIKDENGSYNPSTGYYTAKISGWLRVSATLSIAANATAARLLEIVDSSTGSTVLDYTSTATATGSWFLKGSANIFLKAGETFYINTWQNSGSSLSAGDSGGSFSNLSVERISGPSQIAASESVSALYTGAPPTGTVGAASNLVTFGTKVKDSHNAYSSGVYTVPASGTYDVSAALRMNTNITLVGQIAVVIVAVDGVDKYQGYWYASYTGAQIAPPTVNVKSIPLLQGQTVSIRSYIQGTSPMHIADGTSNFFSITRTGNY